MRTLNTSVVTISGSRLAGGLFSSVRRLHQTLSQNHSVKVRVFTLRDKYSENDEASWSPLCVDTFPVSGPHQFGYSPTLKKALLHSKTDIGHTHGLWVYPSVVMSSWHKKTGRPYIISPHGMLDPWAVNNSAWKKKMALLFYEREHLDRAACLRGLCESEAQSIRGFGLKNPIAVIPNGIDLPSGPVSAAPWQNAVEPGRKILLFLSRIHPKKGIVNLLKAWAKVQQTSNGKLGEWVLAIAGWDQGGHEAELKRLCGELKISHTDIRESAANDQRRATVLFLGPQFGEAKTACYHHCDAFILPSFSEGLPMVVLESWANSKPVLMTPECNLPEGFQAGAALKIDTTESSLVSGLNELGNMTAMDRNTMGIRGHDLVLERFTWSQVANQMQSVHLWILGGGAKPDCIRTA